jgi:hypothetical protein
VQQYDECQGSSPRGRELGCTVKAQLDGDAEELTRGDKLVEQVGSRGSDIGTAVVERCNYGGNLGLDSLVEGS